MKLIRILIRIKGRNIKSRLKKMRRLLNALTITKIKFIETDLQILQDLRPF